MVLPPTRDDLRRDATRPYFRWWTECTLDELRARCRTAKLALAMFSALVSVMGCSDAPANSCSWDYFCLDYLAGFTEETGRDACAEASSPSTFSMTYSCDDEGVDVRRVAHCTITSSDGAVATRLHHYDYAGALSAAEFEAAFCPGPAVMAGWSYEFQAD